MEDEHTEKKRERTKKKGRKKTRYEIDRQRIGYWREIGKRRSGECMKGERSEKRKKEGKEKWDT